MRPGREVQFSTILLSCVLVLSIRTCACRAEDAPGVPARFSCCVYPVAHSLPPSIHEVLDAAFSSRLDLMQGLHAAHSEALSPAMALPDGPGAVCLGGVGFVCVSLMRNRRIWISLCLFVLSHGRISAARLSRMGIPASDPAGSDSLGESGSNHLRRRNASGGDRGLVVVPGISRYVGDVLGWGLEVRLCSLHRLCDDPGSTGLLSSSHAVCDGSWTVSLPRAHHGIAGRSACGRCIEMARPPPPISRLFRMKRSCPRISAYWHDKGEKG